MLYPRLLVGEMVPGDFAKKFCGAPTPEHGQLAAISICNPNSQSTLLSKLGGHLSELD